MYSEDENANRCRLQRLVTITLTAQSPIGSAAQRAAAQAAVVIERLTRMAYGWYAAMTD